MSFQRLSKRVEGKSLCELTAGQARSASECVRRSHCAAGHTPTQTGHRTHLSGGRADSVHTATADKTRQSCLCRVLLCRCELDDCPERLQSTFSVGDSLELSGIQFTPLKRTRPGQDSFVVSGVSFKTTVADICLWNPG